MKITLTVVLMSRALALFVMTTLQMSRKPQVWLIHVDHVPPDTKNT